MLFQRYRRTSNLFILYQNQQQDGMLRISFTSSLAKHITNKSIRFSQAGVAATAVAVAEATTILAQSVLWLDYHKVSQLRWKNESIKMVRFVIRLTNSLIAKHGHIRRKIRQINFPLSSFCLQCLFHNFFLLPSELFCERDNDGRDRDRERGEGGRDC